MSPYFTTVFSSTLLRDALNKSKIYYGGIHILHNNIAKLKKVKSENMSHQILPRLAHHKDLVRIDSDCEQTYS